MGATTEENTMRVDVMRASRAIAERREELGMTQAQFGVKAGVSTQTVSALENGKWRTPRTLPKVEAALGWARGSINAIMRGGEPTPLQSETPSATPVQPTLEEAAEAILAAGGPHPVKLSAEFDEKVRAMAGDFVRHLQTMARGDMTLDELRTVECRILQVIIDSDMIPRRD